MQSRVFQPLVEVFLLVEQPRQRLSHWSQALAPLDDASAPPVATIDAYYDPSSNQAIFGLRYDELALGRGRLGFLVEVALLAEIGMIQPAELSEGDRRRFVGERLARCTVHVGDQRKVVSALVELVRRVRGQKPSTSPPTLAAAMSPMRSRSRSGSGMTPPGRTRGDTADPPLLVARGTRPVGDEPLLPRSTRDLARGSVRQPKLDAPAPADADAVPQAELKRVVSEPIPTPAPRAIHDPDTTPNERPDALADEPITTPDAPVAEPITTPGQRLVSALPQRRDDGPRPSPNVIARAGVHRATTVMMSTFETRRMLEAASEAAEVTESQIATTPFLPSTQEPPPPAASTIYARYLRNGRWVPIRIGSLSLKGAVLMAGAMPRVDDRVDIALAFANQRALVRGSVAKLSTLAEAAATGATTFTVAFELDDASRRQLTALLTAARAAHVTIKPPPPRSTRRYPVEWPVCLGTARGAVRGEALDVSTDGMFVAPVHPLALDANVTFTAVLDDGPAPVSGRARVVRSITETEAKVAGLSPGYGVLILEMPDLDRERWCGFLTRIERRAAKRVLIGASPARLAELQGGLAAAGYAVTGGTDPGDIAQLASAEARPVDAALIDAAWIAAGSSPAWVESLFSGRNVPCVTMHGDARRARIAIDRLLAVV